MRGIGGTDNRGSDELLAKGAEAQRAAMQRIAQENRQGAAPQAQLAMERGKPPVITSPDQLAGLKPGQAFRSPNGKIRYFMPERVERKSQQTSAEG